MWTPLLATLAQAQVPTLNVEHYELQNGLDVILAPDPAVPVVQANVWYWVGSRDEERGRTGFAHLFEHLMFQGSVSQPGEYFGPLERVGGSINGSTTSDRTNYFEGVPREHLPLALFLESDRMGWLLEEVDQPKLDNQREVVRNERRQRIENVPYGDAYLLLNELLYPPGHGYRHPTIGSHEDLEAATLDDVKAFFRKWYAPSNASLVIAGDFDPKLARDLVEQYFGDLPAAEAPATPVPPTPVLSTGIERREYRPVPLRKVWLAWHTPASFAADDAELDLLAGVLADGRDSRLYRALVDERKVAQDVAAWQGSRGWSSTFTITATAAEGHTTDEVIQVIDEVLAEVLHGEAPPTADEVAGAVAGLELGVWRRLQTVAGRADLLNAYQRELGHPDGLAEDLARFSAATPEGLAEAGRRWLDAPRAALHVLPEADRPAPPTVADQGEGPRRKGKKKDQKKKHDPGGGAPAPNAEEGR